MAMHAGSAGAGHPRRLVGMLRNLALVAAVLVVTWLLWPRDDLTDAPDLDLDETLEPVGIAPGGSAL